MIYLNNYYISIIERYCIGMRVFVGVMVSRLKGGTPGDSGSGRLAPGLGDPEAQARGGAAEPLPLAIVYLLLFPFDPLGCIRQ